MRQFSFHMNGAAHLRPLVEDHQEAPAVPAHEVEDPLRRRLEDAVEDVFHAALRRGDQASAEQLLDVLENMQARARVRLQHDRKSTAPMLERTHKELESHERHAMPGGAAAVSAEASH